MEKYIRKSLEVQVIQYEHGKDMEDGFMPWSQVITNGWISTDGLVQTTREDGTVVCPFIQNRRGLIFLRTGDYIILEKDCERHVCGEDKFKERFELLKSE